MLDNNNISMCLKSTTKYIYYCIRQFYYTNLIRRNEAKISEYLYSCKNINSVLKTSDEVQKNYENVRKLKLYPHKDKPKNWDCYRAFSFILKHGNKDSKILDVGSADYGVILPWLEIYGFTSLYGCDISYRKDFKRGNITYYKKNLMDTGLPSNFFDFITSISVIEHGVIIDTYLKEMSRLLKNGGYLLTSADYWPDPIDTAGYYPYGKELGEMKIFTKNEIEDLVKIANHYGLELIEPINYNYQDKVVHWKSVDKKYTFIFFILKKK